MPLDAFYLCVAVGPVGVYLLLLGCLHLSGRPWLTTGGRDNLALGIALTGLAMVGPMELFMPEAAAGQFGRMIWLLLLSFYWLVITLWVLVARPRIVIYNISLAETKQLLEQALTKIDAQQREFEARYLDQHPQEDLTKVVRSDTVWAGDSAEVSRLGLQFHLDSYPQMHTASIIAIGDEQSFTGWRRLRQALSAELQGHLARPRALGVALVVIGLLLILYPIHRMWLDPKLVAYQIAEMFRL